MVILLHSSAHSYDTSASCVTRLPSPNGIFYSFEWEIYFGAENAFVHHSRTSFSIICKTVVNGMERRRRTADTQQKRYKWFRLIECCDTCEETIRCFFLSLFTIVLFLFVFDCVFAIDRVASMPNTGVEEEYYRLRHFSITGKGVVNRGDSLKSRRSRSNNSVASSNSR